MSLSSNLNRLLGEENNELLRVTFNRIHRKPDSSLEGRFLKGEKLSRNFFFFSFHRSFPLISGLVQFSGISRDNARANRFSAAMSFGVYFRMAVVL